MANRLKMDNVFAVLALHTAGLSNREIARKLGIDRETVGRHIRQATADSNAATNAPPGSAGRAEVSKPGSGGALGSALDGEAGLAWEEGPRGDSSYVDRPDCPGPQASELPPWCPNSDACPDSRAWPVGDSESGGHAAPAPGSASACQKHRETILGKMQEGLTAQRIYQDLVTDSGFTGSYYSVRRFVRKVGKADVLPFRRMECLPGTESQVDFGAGAPILGVDGRRRTHVFRIVLSYSRKGYSEAVWRQTTDDFLNCLENAFWEMGGVSRTIVIDNLKAAVKHPDWYDPELNPKVESFCRHYGTVILPTKPYMPRHKGKVERGVDYVQENGLKGRTFTSLQEENRHLWHWEATVADTRIHGTTRRQVGKVFVEVERAALLPLPAGRFPFFQESRRRVHRDGHIEVAKAYYSVPPEYVGRDVWVRWDGRLVRIFNNHREQVAVHAQQEIGRFSTQNQHIDSRKVSAVEKGAQWLLRQIRFIGPQTDRWAQAMLQARGVEGIRVLVGLRSLAKRYPSAAIEDACEKALSHEAFRLRILRELLKRGGDRQEEFEFLKEHQIIRDMAEYGNLVRASIRREPAVFQPPCMAKGMAT